MNDPLIGQHLGNYRLDTVVGRGGMATVYLGWDVSLHRPVAVKVIDARYRDNPAYAERFLQEARAVATWRHDNILQVFYAGQQDDLYYFAMEFVDGPDLGRVMKQYADEGELMPHKDVLHIGLAVAEALDYAHSQDIIHRDVKPSNVMVAKDGRVALADFGLALNAQQGSLGGTFGTPHYIAPEQARNSATAVPQSDLYALGVILYEMLTGSVPFDDPSPTSLAVQHLTQPPPPPRQLNPNLNAATEKMLLKALNKQPANRYQSGAALMEALTEALTTSEDTHASVFLPPLPAGVVAPALSSVSVVERVSLYLPPPPPAMQGAVPVTAPQPAPITQPFQIPASSLSSAKRRLPMPVTWLVGGGIVILLLLAARWVVWGRADEETTAVVPLSTTVTAVAITETAVSAVVPTVAHPTATAFPITVTVETDTAVVPAPSATAPPTVVAISPPETPPPAAPPTDTLAPTATPTGLRLVMFYDATSFYLYNPNVADIRVSQFVFESLDDNGNPSGYWFEGRSWSQFYSFVEQFSCARLEMTKVSGWLRPSSCRRYNATITPEQDGDIVFWTSRPGVAAFRVMWQGQEVGRCAVTASQCEVYLP